MDIEITDEAGETALTFHCSVSGATPLTLAHRATDALERELRERLPALGRVTIHVEPDEPGTSSDATGRPSAT